MEVKEKIDYIIRKRTNQRYRLFKRIDGNAKQTFLIRKDDRSVLEFNSANEATTYCKLRFKKVPIEEVIK
jgi:hypothetical protein